MIALLELLLAIWFFIELGNIFIGLGMILLGTLAHLLSGILWGSARFAALVCWSWNLAIYGKE